MEIANIPVPVAAVLYQQLIFLTVTQLAVSHSMTLLWVRLYVTTKFHYSEGSKSLLMN